MGAFIWGFGGGGGLHNPSGFSLRGESTGSICHCLHHGKSWLNGMNNLHFSSTFSYFFVLIIPPKKCTVHLEEQELLLFFVMCKLKMHETPLCLLQICVLLFTCLYIVCYLILTHFKKTAEFVTGEFVMYSIFL